MLWELQGTHLSLVARQLIMAATIKFAAGT